jgi:hypothetical protein
MDNKINYAQIDEQVKSEKNIEFAYRSLKQEWNYDDKFLMKVAKEFECATSGNIYLDSLDAMGGDIHAAWIRYCETIGMPELKDDNPF